MSVRTQSALVMTLDDYRGLSAYEIALQNGFEGSEQQWLQSLRGEPGQDALNLTVNDKAAVGGNITLYAGDVRMQPGLARSVDDAIGALEEARVEVADSLDTNDGAMALSAAQGYALQRGKAAVYAQQITLPTDGWTGEGPYTQDISVETVVEDETSCHLVFGYTPGYRDAFGDCGLQAIAQKDGAVTLQADSLPAEAFSASLLVIRQGVSA